MTERIASLRQAFDRTFALPGEAEREAMRDFIQVRLSGQWFALPVVDLVEVERERGRTPLPAAPFGCLGVSGVRGRLVAVYDLGMLLGLQRPPETQWLVLPRANDTVAIAVPEISGYLRAPESAVVERDAEANDARTASLSHEGCTLSVLDLARLLAGIASGEQELVR